MQNGRAKYTADGGEGASTSVAGITATTRRNKGSKSDEHKSAFRAPADPQGHTGWRRNSDDFAANPNAPCVRDNTADSSRVATADALCAALDRYAAGPGDSRDARGDALFMRRFRLLPQRRVPSRAAPASVVQFASDARGSVFNYALRFFLDSAAYDAEVAAYAVPQLASVMAPMDGNFPCHCEAVPASDQASAQHRRAGAAERGPNSAFGSLCLRSGGLSTSSAASQDEARSSTLIYYPPLLVTERAVPLAEWRPEGGQAHVLAMFQDVARLLSTVHAAGRVHGRLNAHAVLLLLQTQAWRLCDFRTATLAGAQLNLLRVLGSR